MRLSHLGEQVVHDVDADAVVDLAKDAVVAVQRGQAATKEVPLLKAQSAGRT